MVGIDNIKMKIRLSLSLIKHHDMKAFVDEKYSSTCS
jgi:hypothetical protein